MFTLILFPLLPILLTPCSICQARAGTGKSAGTQKLLKTLHRSGSRLMELDEPRKAAKEQTPHKHNPTTQPRGLLGFYSSVSSYFQTRAFCGKRWCIFPGFLFQFCLSRLRGIAHPKAVSTLPAFHSSHNYELANCKYSALICWLFRAKVQYCPGTPGLSFRYFDSLFYALVQPSRWMPPEHLINTLLDRPSPDTSQSSTLICFNRITYIYRNK